jgi:3-hydroxyacyl-CoA dehydrogenase
MKNLSLNERLENVAVIGAAGKMGRGISLVMLQVMIRHQLETKAQQSAQLILVDNKISNLQSLKDYLQQQMLKFAEKNINTIRVWYKQEAKLIDNKQIIDQFLRDSLKLIHSTTNLQDCQESLLIFEAIFEDLPIKNVLYAKLNNICPKNAYFLSNTSSIPIHEINNQGHLEHRIIGFHFYNPPAIQKLVEVIQMKRTPHDLEELSSELIQRLGKILVPSHDIAGFIGNGHFIREGLNAMIFAKKLALEEASAILYSNQIFAEVLVRPMGIFQLIDYVGLDVFKMICETMNSYLKSDFSCPIINQYLNAGICGGQFGDGSQKNGIFQYSQGKISGVYDLKQNKYLQLEDVAIPEIQNLYKASWKILSRDPLKEDKLLNHFSTIATDNPPVAIHAQELLLSSIRIAEKLVLDGVTDNIINVDTVLKKGFFHLYGASSSVLDSIKEASV